MEPADKISIEELSNKKFKTLQPELDNIAAVITHSLHRNEN